ncbi:MAG: NifB/NifX family molybdenum-iron cluster-binding protein [Candidatus Thiodiazotropha sp.]|jgi:predicted Fe-Mo cluster-binding NifX family protein
MKIAVTSQNFRTITAHAGKSRRFLTYETNAQGELVELTRIDLPKELSIHEYKGLTHPLFEFDILVSASAGQGFINRLAQQGVQVICTSETDPRTAAQAIAEGKPLPAPEPHDHTHHHHHHGAPVLPTP